MPLLDSWSLCSDSRLDRQELEAMVRFSSAALVALLAAAMATAAPLPPNANAAPAFVGIPLGPALPRPRALALALTPVLSSPRARLSPPLRIGSSSALSAAEDDPGGREDADPSGAGGEPPSPGGEGTGGTRDRIRSGFRTKVRTFTQSLRPAVASMAAETAPDPRAVAEVLRDAAEGAVDAVSKEIAPYGRIHRGQAFPAPSSPRFVGLADTDGIEAAAALEGDAASCF